MERSVCLRLERIEASLHLLLRKPEAAEARADGPNDIGSDCHAPGCPVHDHAAGCASHSHAEESHSRLCTCSCHWDHPLKVPSEVHPPLALHRDAARTAHASQAAQQKTVNLRPVWQETEETLMEGMMVLRDRDQLGQDGSDGNSKVRGEDEKLLAKPWWILLPSDRFRLCWDLLMIVIIIHDLAVVPVNLAFNVGDSVVSEVLFWPFLFFWTADIFLSFTTAFYSSGQLEVRLPKIVMRYIRTWFILDLFMVGSTWFEVAVDEDNKGILLGRVGKVLKVFRTLRFLRMAKLQSTTADTELIMSEYSRILFSVSKLILLIVWLNHFIACSWWAVGVHTSDGVPGDSWTSYHKMEGQSLYFQYFTSLHWSLTQFTPAGMEVSARNTYERMFSVAVLLFAMVAFSSFVSSITAHITQLRQINDRHDANFALLRRYLRFHRVPMELTLRILQCVEFRLGKQKKEIQEGQVQYLQFLSKPLQLELSLRIFAPIVTQHPFFQRYSEVDSEAMRRICLEALAQCLLSTEDLLFTEGGTCEEMFFLVSGQLRYNFRAPVSDEVMGTATIEEMSYVDVFEAECCCEVSMWCSWVHCGTMTAHLMSEVLAVNVAAFTGITRSFLSVHRFTVRYARMFAQRTNDHFLEGHAISDVSSFSDLALEVLAANAAVPRKKEAERVHDHI